MKKTLSLLIGMSISLMAFAQDETAAAEEPAKPWKKGAITTLNFTQVAMDNWAAGGQNSISGVAFFNGFANYTKGNATWDNTLNLGYGMQKLGDADWYKNDDKLEFTSKYGLQANDKWYYSGLLDFRTQFDKGYADPAATDYISNIFAPAYLNLALGMDYKPNENLTVFISPLTAKMTFVNDTALSNDGAFGVDAGESFRAEMGAYVKVGYTKELMENISYVTTLGLFSNYANNPENIDVNWDNLLVFKINEYFNASIMFNMIYDDDIKFDVDDDGVIDGPRLQWKEMFGLGITYKL